MKRFPSAMILLVAMSCLAAEVEVVEKNQKIIILNEHYIATISKAMGGMLELLETADGRALLLSGHQIYTDVGIYPVRAYVGTRNEANPRVAITRRDGTVVVTSGGFLRGKVAEGRKLVSFGIVYVFDQSPAIRVECRVTPPEKIDDARCFLATCFHLPQMREWAVNTIDGVIREDVREGTGRNYQARDLWINTSNPWVRFINRDGSVLTVSDIESEAPMPLANIIIHGRAFFLAYLDGSIRRVLPEEYTVRFVIKVER